jgi:DNA-binding NarL/FixJ family response regulator
MQSISKLEQQVIALLAQGCEDDQIARTVNRSEQAIRTCIADVLNRLGLSSRVELLFWYHSQMVSLTKLGRPTG